MSKHPNKISEIRRQKKVTQQQLADRLGVHVITVSKLERGVMQLTGSWINRLATALEVSEAEIWGGFQLVSMGASGRLTTGDRVTVVDPENNRFSSYRSLLGEPDSRWLHVQDNALLPFFGEGDLVQFSLAGLDLQTVGIFDGRLCMYAAEGNDDILIGSVDKQISASVYDLRSMNGRQMKEVRVQVIWFLSGYLPNWGVVAHFDTEALQKQT